jgi:hypothetical protein
VDTFVFGATTVIRNPSVNLPSNAANPALNCAGKKDANWSRVFTFPHKKLPQLTREGLILFAILRGGDYHSGIDGCGPKIASGIACTPLATRLFQIASTLPIDQEALSIWRLDLCQELKTNASGLLPNKCLSLSRKVPLDFPPIDVLTTYVHPITSQTHKGAFSRNKPLTWSNDPDLAKIAALCERSFEWGYKEHLIQRFRTLLWPWMALRCIRRVCMNPDTPLTCHLPPSLKGIAPQEPSDALTDLFLTTSLERTHASTNNLIEYRVSVNPCTFVALAESGLLGIRQAPDIVSDGNYDEADQMENNHKVKPSQEPSEPFLMWIPAILADAVSLTAVKVFKDQKRLKDQRKARKHFREIRTGLTSTSLSSPADYREDNHISGVQSTAVANPRSNPSSFTEECATPSQQHIKSRSKVQNQTMQSFYSTVKPQTSSVQPGNGIKSASKKAVMCRKKSKTIPPDPLSEAVKAAQSVFVVDSAPKSCQLALSGSSHSFSVSPPSSPSKVLALLSNTYPSCSIPETFASSQNIQHLRPHNKTQEDHINCSIISDTSTKSKEIQTLAPFPMLFENNALLDAEDLIDELQFSSDLSKAHYQTEDVAVSSQKRHQRKYTTIKLSSTQLHVDHTVLHPPVNALYFLNGEGAIEPLRFSQGTLPSSSQLTYSQQDASASQAFSCTTSSSKHSCQSSSSSFDSGPITYLKMEKFKQDRFPDSISDRDNFETSQLDQEEENQSLRRKAQTEPISYEIIEDVIEISDESESEGIDESTTSVLTIIDLT